MEPLFTELVARLRSAHSNNLVSVVLYGSAIADGVAKPKADYRVLVVMEALSAEDLRHARPPAKWWADSGFSLPVYLTREELSRSLDVFPIEFRHMKQAYRVLYGDDLLAETDVSKANLRLQTESELRGKMLRLRSLYLPASDSAEGLTRLMTDSVVTFVQLLRPVLELLGEQPPISRSETIRRAHERLKLDTSSLERILKLRSQPARLLELEAHDLFSSYLDCLKRVIEEVDNL
jgi:hypothetical protein